jgi:hypothetical protein
MGGWVDGWMGGWVSFELGVGAFIASVSLRRILHFWSKKVFGESTVELRTQGSFAIATDFVKTDETLQSVDFPG